MVQRKTRKGSGATLEWCDILGLFGCNAETNLFVSKRGTTLNRAEKVMEDSRNKYQCAPRTRVRQSLLALKRRSAKHNGKTRNRTAFAKTGRGTKQRAEQHNYMSSVQQHFFANENCRCYFGFLTVSSRLCSNSIKSSCLNLFLLAVEYLQMTF